MNADKLTEHLSGDIDGINLVLEDLGFQNISHYSVRNEYRFAREGGSNPSSVKLNCNDLSFFCFSTSERGNLYTLAMDRFNYTFPEALHYVADLLKLDKKEFDKKVRHPFGGFYKKITKTVEEPEIDMETYDLSVLDDYKEKYNTMFFKDEIDYLTQEKYQIGYDFLSNRIVVPEFTFDGRLCGIMGRLNEYDCDKSVRWLPIIPCSRSLTLFGYHRNYADIQKKGMCIVGESEKFPMQLTSMGCHIGLASCGCRISPTQSRYLKGLLIPKIILAYDEGLDEEDVRHEAEKLLVNNSVITNNVGYVYDSDNEVIPKGSKGSPADYGVDGFKHLMKNCVVWLKE